MASVNDRAPSHYQSQYQAWDVIKDWGLNFNMGNAIKYIARADRKGQKRQDLTKAIHYLQKELENVIQDSSTGLQASVPDSEFEEYLCARNGYGFDS